MTRHRSRVPAHPWWPDDYGTGLYCRRCGLPKRHPAHTCTACRGAGIVLTSGGRRPCPVCTDPEPDPIPPGLFDA